jgi:pyrroline-5-carboxylate reductase
MHIDRITFIGGGNMASALAGGLCAAGFDPGAILVTGRSEAGLADLRERFGVGTCTDNVAAVRGAQLVVLAVKPGDIAAVARQIGAAVRAQEPLVLSVAAGIPIAAIDAALGGFRRIVRAMPNRPALLGKGVSALFAAPGVDAGARAAAESTLRSVGAVVWLEQEAQMDAATAVSGSGTAYFFLLIEALEQAAREQGLPAEVARTLAVQTAHGAGCMAQMPAGDPARLRAAVTSPGGTTAAALAVLENADLRGIVRRAVAAARQRAEELSR